MEARKQEPLDEIQYRRPDIIQWWVSRGGQPMDENMIHRYLSESPFFDYATNNGLIFTHASTNAAADQLVANRNAFEEQLKKQRGIEYMITGDPQPTTNDPKGPRNGMWTIRKQDREKVRAGDFRAQDQLTTLGTYYAVGENMYQAPSVGDIIGNRLLNATTNLAKFFDQAAALPSFDPTRGYSYLPANSHTATSTTSVQVSPAHSREGSVSGGADSQSLRSVSVPPDGLAGAANTSTQISDRLLARSLEMAINFGDEYMDENPLLGEPGNFSFTSSTAAVKRRKAEEEAATVAAKAKDLQRATPQPQSPKAPSPPPVMTEAKALKSEKDRRANRMAKEKRRKSRANNALSPTTPGSAGADAAH